jgi:hypothetical protein
MLLINPQKDLASRKDNEFFSETASRVVFGLEFRVTLFDEEFTLCLTLLKVNGIRGARGQRGPRGQVYNVRLMVNSGDTILY